MNSPVESKVGWNPAARCTVIKRRPRTTTCPSAFIVQPHFACHDFNLFQIAILWLKVIDDSLNLRSQLNFMLYSNTFILKLKMYLIMFSGSL